MVNNDYKNIIASYVPQTILKWYRNQTENNYHFISQHTGTLFFIDASGFTELTRKLSSLGKAGPEILTETLNEFFRSLEKIISDYNGDILKFAGDAVWVFFEDDIEVGLFHLDCLKAIKDLNECLEQKNMPTLQVHSGADYGSFALVSLGNNQERLEIEIIGNICQYVGKAADLAQGGELVIGRRLAEKTGLKLKVRCLLDDFFVVEEIKTPVSARVVFKKQNPDIIKNYLIEKYLPAEVLRKIGESSEHNSVVSEYREAIPLFTCFTYNHREYSINEIEDLNNYVKRAFQIIRSCDGSIARIDPYSDGHKLLVLFGTPVRREQDELNAIKCAMELIKLSGEKLRLKIGLSLGMQFCGEVGCAIRREYTVMGDSINLSARLMANADYGSILIDKAFMSKLSDKLITEPVVMSLKGINNRFEAYKFIGIQETEKSYKNGNDLDFFGFALELNELETLWQRHINNEKISCHIIGENGIGRSTLINKLISRHEHDGIIHLSGENSLLYHNGWLAGRLLEKLYHKKFSGRDISLKEFLENIVDGRWHPLFADFTNFKYNENQWTSNLTPELRFEKVMEIFHQVLYQLCHGELSIIVDDYNYTDEISQNLLLSLKEMVGLNTCFIVFATTCLENNNESRVIKLSPPDSAVWKKWYFEKVENGKREQELFDELLQVSGGVPQFVLQFLTHCIDTGILQLNKITDKYEIENTNLQITVPQDFNNLYLAQFDTLPEKERDILKTASVFNTGFNLEMLKDISLTAPVKPVLDILIDKQILRKKEDSTYEFNSQGLRTAIYNCIPQSVLKQIHSKTAICLENGKFDAPSKLLAYHYYHAENTFKGFVYSFDAAQEAFNSYSLVETAKYYEQCHIILQKNGDDIFDFDLLKQFYRKYSYYLVHESQYKKAYLIYKRWRKQSYRKMNTEELIQASFGTADLLWKQSRYGQCRKILSACLDKQHENITDYQKSMICNLMAEIYRREGKFEQSLGWTSKAIDYAESISDYKILADALNNQGLAKWGTGNLRGAAQSYQKSMDAGKEHNDILLRAKTINNLAIIKWELGNFNDAEKLMEKAQSIYFDVGDKRKEAYASGNLASLYKIFGKLDKAWEMFERADLIFKKLNDRHAHHYTVGNIGDIELIKGNLETAGRLFNEAYDFARQVDDKELMTESEVRFGDLLFFEGDINESKKQYDKAISLAEEINSNEYLLRGSIGMARLMIGLKNHKSALELIDRIHSISDKEGIIIAKKEADFLKAEYYRIIDKPDKAIIYLKEIFEYAEKEDIFELKLKSLTRLFELEKASTVQHLSKFEKIINKFEKNNHLTGWSDIAASAYFSHFAGTLSRISSQFLSNSIK